MKRKTGLLCASNPLPFDSDVSFDEPTHTYTLRGRKVPLSVTGLLKRAFGEFDSRETALSCLPKWRGDKFCRYNALVRYLQLVENQDDAGVADAVAALWATEGRAAAAAGTAVHAAIQAHLEGWPVSPSPELGQFEGWLEEFSARTGMRPFRSELSVVFEANGVPLLAGQIDLVLRDDQGRFAAVDFKTTNPAPKRQRGPQHLIAKDLPHFGRFGKGRVSHLPENDFYKYSLQVSLYAAMAKRLGIDFTNRCYALQIHADLGSGHFVKLAPLQAEAEGLLAELEESSDLAAERLDSVNTGGEGGTALKVGELGEDEVVVVVEDENVCSTQIALA
jgi:hypothetical protein